MIAMDIRAGITAAIVLSAVGVLISVWLGVRAIRAARHITYFRIKRQQVAAGWRLIGLALVLSVAALWLGVGANRWRIVFIRPARPSH
jgi:hypothetical protein